MFVCVWQRKELCFVRVVDNQPPSPFFHHFCYHASTSPADQHQQQVKLIDLGMAGLYRPTKPMQGCMGSPGFIAPEVILGEPHTVGVQGEKRGGEGGEFGGWVRLHQRQSAVCTSSKCVHPGQGSLSSDWGSHTR